MGVDQWWKQTKYTACFLSEVSIRSQDFSQEQSFLFDIQRIDDVTEQTETDHWKEEDFFYEKRDYLRDLMRQRSFWKCGIKLRMATTSNTEVIHWEPLF